MNSRVRKMHPFGPPCPDETACDGYYFTPIVLPDAYRHRHQAGHPFSKAELIAIVEGGLMQTPDRGELSVPISSLNVSVWHASDDDWWFVDHFVGFACADDHAAPRIQSLIEQALEPINALWLIECAVTGAIWTMPSYSVGCLSVEVPAT
jgi:hypothetical protein